jgi:hypothetical protein
VARISGKEVVRIFGTRMLAEKKPSGDAFEPAPKIEEGSAC